MVSYFLGFDQEHFLTYKIVSWIAVLPQKHCLICWKSPTAILYRNRN